MRAPGPAGSWVGHVVVAAALISLGFGALPVSPPEGPHGLNLVWSHELVDAQGKTGWWPSIDLDTSGRPAIAYAELNASRPDSTPDRLRFAVRNGSWSTETADPAGAGAYPSLRADGGRVTVAYLPDEFGGPARFAERDTKGWAVIGLPNVGGRALSQATLADGRRAVAFVDPGDGLFLAREDSTGAWTTSRVTGNVWDVPMHGLDFDVAGSSLAIGMIALDPARPPLAWSFVGDGAQWTPTAIATSARGRIAIAHDPGGDVHVAFWYNETYLVHYFSRRSESDRWSGEGVYVAASAQDPNSLDLAVGADGKVRIAFLLDGSRLMYGVREPGWVFSEVRHEADMGAFVSLAVDGSGTPHLAYLDARLNDLWYSTVAPGGANRPPEVRVSASGDPSEGSAILLDASASSDPDGDGLQFRWDFDSDGTWDTSLSPSPTTTHVWGDDVRDARVTVEATDGLASAAGLVLVTVSNVAPAIGPPDVDVTGVARVIVRVAGEKFHDVTATLCLDGVAVSSATVLRRPGNPDAQRVDLGTIEAGGNYSAVLSYTPADDAANGQAWGATPAWIILNQSGQEEWLHHTFNVRHPESWTWRVEDLSSHLVPSGVAVRFLLTDPGSDDLIVQWGWGDGTAEAMTFLNDPAVPHDPSPSPDVNPRAIEFSLIHEYAAPGTYHVVLHVSDDDGGVAALEFDVVA